MGSIRRTSYPADPEEHTDKHTLPVTYLFQILWRRRWLIAAVAICCAGIGVVYSLMQSPKYEASVRILIGQKPSSDPLGSLPVDSMQQITQTMVEAIDSRHTAEDVIQWLHLKMTPEDFLTHMSVEQVDVTQFIEVRYVSESPERAQQVANTIGDVFSSQVSGMNLTANQVTAAVYERAVVPDSPVGAGVILTGTLALATGLMLGVALAFLLEYVDRTTKPNNTGKPNIRAGP
jgi:capsular polysaccharide biosynthesis protein